MPKKVKPINPNASGRTGKGPHDWPEYPIHVSGMLHDEIICCRACGMQLTNKEIVLRTLKGNPDVIDLVCEACFDI